MLKLMQNQLSTNPVAQNIDLFVDPLSDGPEPVAKVHVSGELKKCRQFSEYVLANPHFNVSFDGNTYSFTIDTGTPCSICGGMIPPLVDFSNSVLLPPSYTSSHVSNVGQVGKDNYTLLRQEMFEDRKSVV